MFFIVVVVFLVLFLYHHLTRYNNYWKDRHVPGPTPTFFFGNVKELVLRRKETSAIYKDIYDKYPNERFIGIFRMRSPTLLIKDLDLIKQIMIKDFHLFMDREPQFSEKGLGANLFHSGKDTWQMLRSRFTPIFTSGKLKNMMYLMIESADKLVDYVNIIVKEEPEQEIHRIIKKYTIETIASCAFGLNIDSHVSKRLNELEPKIFIFDYKSELEMMYPGILKKLQLSLMPEEVTKFFNNVTQEIIEQRKGEPTGRNDFMDLLLELRKAKQIYKTMNNSTGRTMEITDEIIAGQTFIFYTAGYQTTATTMSFVLYHLAFDLDIQNKVLAELKAVLETHEGKLTYEAVLDLKYMDQVISETLRMHPVVSTLRRCAGDDYKLPGTNVMLQKGQVVVVPISVVHMDPKNYPDPEVFDPERFSAKNVGARHFCAYLPFGEGLRQCIGQRFARLQSKVGLAKLLSCFQVEPSCSTPEQYKGEAGRMVSFPVGGFPLKLVPRYETLLSSAVV